MISNTIREAISLLMCSFLVLNGIFAVVKACRSRAGKPRSALFPWDIAASLCGVPLSMCFDPLLPALAYIVAFAMIFARAMELQTSQKSIEGGWLYLLLGARDKR